VDSFVKKSLSLPLMSPVTTIFCAIVVDAKVPTHNGVVVMDGATSRVEVLRSVVGGAVILLQRQ